MYLAPLQFFSVLYSSPLEADFNWPYWSDCKSYVKVSVPNWFREHYRSVLMQRFGGVQDLYKNRRLMWYTNILPRTSGSVNPLTCWTHQDLHEDLKFPNQAADAAQTSVHRDEFCQHLVTRCVHRSEDVATLTVYLHIVNSCQHNSAQLAAFWHRHQKVPFRSSLWTGWTIFIWIWQLCY